MKQKFDVTVNGNKYTVSVGSELAGELPEKIKINGFEYSVSIDNINNFKSILLNDIPYALDVLVDDDDKIQEIYVDGDFQLVNIWRHGLPKIKWRKIKAGSGVVLSPIAGKVIDVKKNEGDKVLENDVMVIIEAMKMESEIRSPVAGVVKEMSVNKNDEINSGEQLFIVENA